jgi:hypothetical protein
MKDFDTTVNFIKKRNEIEEFKDFVSIKSNINLAINVLKNKCDNLFNSYNIEICYGESNLSERDKQIFEHIHNAPGRLFNNPRLVIKMRLYPNEPRELNGQMYSLLNPYLMVHQSRTKSQLVISNIKESDYISFISSLNLCYSKIRDLLNSKDDSKLEDKVSISK